MRALFFYTLVLISLFSKGQTIFSNVRECMLVGAFKTSLTQLDSCIAKNYLKDSAIYYKGMTYLKMNNLKEANVNCSTLIKTYPKFNDAHFLQGLIYYSEKKYETSISEFDIVISKAPNHLNAIYNRALALGAGGNYNKCIEGLNKCISLKPM